MIAARFVSIVPLVVAVSSASCDGAKSGSDPKTAAATDKAATPPEPPKVNIDPHQTAAAAQATKPVMVQQQGSFELQVEGTHYHLNDLPFGENRATWFEG